VLPGEHPGDRVPCVQRVGVVRAQDFPGPPASKPAHRNAAAADAVTSTAAGIGGSARRAGKSSTPVPVGPQPNERTRQTGVPVVAEPGELVAEPDRPSAPAMTDGIPAARVSAVIGAVPARA
jgi:hypothetical protein